MNIGSALNTRTISKDNALTGWRGWKVRDDDPYHLYSVSAYNHIKDPKFLWDDQIKVADGVPVIQVGAWSAQCGLYCFKGWDTLASPTPRFEQGHVQGRIKLWGQVVVHERGYRAECAEITGIVVKRAGNRADWFAHILGVPRLRVVPVKWEPREIA